MDDHIKVMETDKAAPVENEWTGSLDTQIAYLETCKRAVKELQDARKKGDALDAREKKLAKSLTAEKKAVEDNVNNTIRKRKEELESSYDTEISKAEDALKKAKSKREKAKQQGIKERIAEHTAPYEAENKELKAQIKTTYKQEGIPVICDTTLYYALYFPKTIKEICIMLITFAICFLAIPVGIYWLIPEHKTFHLILIYLLTIVIFGGLYLLIGAKTRDKHKATITEAQRIRRTMAKNCKKMQAEARSIRSEKSDEHYDLSAQDAEIAEREAELEELGRKKEEAMAYFISTTRPTITEEIVSAKRDKINQMEADLVQTQKDLAEAEVYIKNAVLRMSEDYESYLGKDYVALDKLEALIKILKKGQANSITEAKALYEEQQTAKK